MYNLDWGIAGTLDALFKTDKGLVVGDWKTNARMKLTGGYGKLKEPFETIDDNSLTKYSLQLSLYRLMLQAKGIKTIGGFLGWVSPDGYVQTIKVLDFRDDLRKYLGSTLGNQN